MKLKNIISNDSKTAGVSGNYLNGELTNSRIETGIKGSIGFDPFPRIDNPEIITKKIVAGAPTQAGSGKTCTCNPDVPTQLGSGKTCTCNPDVPTQLGSGKTCTCDPGAPTQAGSGKTCTCDPDVPTQLGSGKSCTCQPGNQFDAHIHGELKSPGFSTGKKTTNVLGSYNPFVA